MTEVVKDDSTQEESKKEATETKEGQTAEVADDSNKETSSSTPVDSPKGKKHALKKYDQFALNTSCFWGSNGSNFTAFVHFTRLLLQK